MTRRGPLAGAVVVLLLVAGCTAPEPDGGPLPSPTDITDDELLDGDEPTGAEAPVDLTLPPDVGPRALVALPPPVPGVFRSNCTTTHFAKDDPIVFPGEDRRAHMHGFHGSTGPFVDEDSTNASLMGHGTTCDKPGDESAYWSPVAAAGDAMLSQDLALTYYRTGGLADPTKIVPFPPGFRMIAGSALATTAQDPEIAVWGCTNEPTATTENASVPPTECPLGEKLKLKITFPNCWDGRNLDSPNHGAGAVGSHVAYAWQDDGNRRACPASHPVQLPELQVGFRWNVRDTDDLAALRLTSGNVFSGHADFMNGWDQAVLADLVSTCLNVPTQCDRGVD